MKRIHVSMPDELYVRMTEMGLSPSTVLRKAIEDVLEKERLRLDMDQWLSDMEAEVGPPSANDVAWAEEVVARVQRREPT